MSWSQAGRWAALLLGIAVLAFLIVWVFFLAENAATNDWYTFVLTTLNGITLAGLYFIVASGFTLIFGLMRVVNMAHGTFFLLGGYIALTLQRHWVGKGDIGLQSSDVDRFWIEWVFPLLIGGLVVGLIGLGMQQSLLRWNQGQELRQALITIAFSIIVADLMLEHWGGVAKDIAIPLKLDRFVNLRIESVQYSVFRLFILFFAVGVGVLLWLWLKKTRTGMVIRAGVDDRAMVQALGINIQITFAIAFFVGSFLAGLGGGFGGSFGTLAPGLDGQFLLNSLVVVIIGGMGSLGGAAIGALLYGMVGNFAATYLPSDYNPYSIIFTFVLLAVVLAVRPLGLFGETGVRLTIDRVVGLVLVVLIAISPLYASDYFVTTTLTTTLYLGIAAASLIFLSAYGGMVSLAQVSLAGIAGFAYGNLVATGGSKGMNLGYSPWIGIVGGVAIATVVGLVFGAIASRSIGIYFLMITLVYSVIVYYFFGQVTQLSGFGGVQVQRLPGVMGDAAEHPYRLFYVTFGAAIFVYVLIRFILRTPFGLALQGVRDEPVRMASLGFAVPLHRTLAFGLAAFIASLAGLLNAWSDGIIAPSSIDLNRTIDVLVIAVLGGLLRVEGAWVGAFAFVLINNYIQDYLGTYGDRIRTVVGLIFLVIVLVAPAGLMGLWERLTHAVTRGRGGSSGPSVDRAAEQGA